MQCTNLYTGEGRMGGGAVYAFQIVGAFQPDLLWIIEHVPVA